MGKDGYIIGIWVCRLCGKRFREEICIRAGSHRTLSLEWIAKNQSPKEHKCEAGTVGLADFIGRM